MRIHLGHHFYGAGNLGDDFMLAGFLEAMAPLAPDATFSGCVPFPLDPLRRRFPQIEWFEYTRASRGACIQLANVWLGLGGSPFQSAQSRWFIDHLREDAELCDAAQRPMFFLGVGVQRESELADADVARICAGARGIWTRDATSAQRLASSHPGTPIRGAADLSHAFFRHVRPPTAKAGRVAVVANSDYNEWPTLESFVTTLESVNPTDRVWLAQESRELPGAERSLHKTLSPKLRARWVLRDADSPNTSTRETVAAWPTPEWLLTSRYHAAIASAWGAAKVVVVALNEKLGAVAADLDAPLISPSATADELHAALASARPATATRLDALAASAEAACCEFVAAARTT